ARFRYQRGTMALLQLLVLGWRWGFSRLMTLTGADLCEGLRKRQRDRIQPFGCPASPDHNHAASPLGHPPLDQITQGLSLERQHVESRPLQDQDSLLQALPERYDRTCLADDLGQDYVNLPAHRIQRRFRRTGG